MAVLLEIGHYIELDIQWVLGLEMGKHHGGKYFVTEARALSGVLKGNVCIAVHGRICGCMCLFISVCSTLIPESMDGFLLAHRYLYNSDSAFCNSYCYLFIVKRTITIATYSMIGDGDKSANLLLYLSPCPWIMDGKGWTD